MKDIREFIRDFDTKEKGAMTREEVINYFSYHSPTPAKARLHERMNDAFLDLALFLKDELPECADQTVALRKLMDARMAANLVIACND